VSDDDDVDRQKASACITYILSPIRDFRLKFQKLFRSPFEVDIYQFFTPSSMDYIACCRWATADLLPTGREWSILRPEHPYFDMCLLRYLCDTSDLFGLRSAIVSIWSACTGECAVGVRLFSGLYVILSTVGAGLSQTEIYWHFCSICFEMSFLWKRRDKKVWVITMTRFRVLNFKR
jgi:hypothetical protein